MTIPKKAGAEALPPFIMNSIPKSGTHLLTQILLGMPGITHSPAKHLYQGTGPEINQHRQVLSSANVNEFISGHIYYSLQWAEMMKKLGMKQIFLLRDPRDLVISLVYFMHRIPNYPIYPLLMKPGITQSERYLIVINGVKSPQLHYPGIAEWVRIFQGWMHAPNVLSVSYEQLYSSGTAQDMSLRKIIQFLWGGLTLPLPLPQMVQSMKDNIRPGASPTFRKGGTNQWQGEFAPEVKAAFKQVAGDLLIELGYESNKNW